jgi:DNA repair protein RadC
MQAKRVDVVSVKLVKEASFLYAPRKIASPSDAAGMVKDFLQEADREKFVVVCLNTKNEPNCCSVVSTGTLNSSLVHPREVFKVALLANSAAIILSHNHPSGDPSPSQEDLEVTRRLAEAGKILGVDVLDHIVVGSSGIDKDLLTQRLEELTAESDRLLARKSEIEYELGDETAEPILTNTSRQ